MPVRQIQHRPFDADARSLSDRLAAEWATPDPAAAQPVIVEERAKPGGALHLYVVWDDWADLDGIERSEIIMDAFIRHFGRDEATNVTVAMGLTPREADRMRVPYKD